MDNALLLDFFKTMNNEYRLQIAGLLMAGECSVRELAEMLHLKPNDVLDHLATLRLLNLVTSHPQADQTVYRFNKKALYAMSQQVLYTEKTTPVDHLPPQQRDVLRHFFEGDRLTIIPESYKKLTLLLEWLVTHFEAEKRYSEAEVNAILGRYHEDYATLRRGMIDTGLMQRDKGIYWRHG